jgi:hypothetical protein
VRLVTVNAQFTWRSSPTAPRQTWDMPRFRGRIAVGSTKIFCMACASSRRSTERDHCGCGAQCVTRMGGPTGRGGSSDQRTVAATSQL